MGIQNTVKVRQIQHKVSSFVKGCLQLPSIAGYGYIMPPKLVPALLKRVQEVKIIAMEDVFFTGKMDPSTESDFPATNTLRPVSWLRLLTNSQSLAPACCINSLHRISKVFILLAGLVPQGLGMNIHWFDNKLVAKFTSLDRFMAHVITRRSLIQAGHVHDKRLVQYDSVTH